MSKQFSRGPAACGRCASQKSFLKALALLVLMLVVNCTSAWADVTLYLNTGGNTLWNQGGAKFAIYYFNSEDDYGWSNIMTVESGNIFVGTIPDDYGSVNFVRLSSSATLGNWNDMLNKTGDLTLGADNMYTITGMGSGTTSTGEWSTYTPAPPAPAVSYLSPVYNTPGTPTSGINHWDTLSCTTYTALTSSMTTWGTAGQDTWYVVNANTTINSYVSYLTCAGNVHLILMNGYTLTTDEIIVNNGSATLTIYAQDTTNSVMGVLNATGNTGNSGIGGSDGNSNGTITINGGKVTANGGTDGAGIGGGDEGNGSNITINGGYVTATGDGAGIGGGEEGYGSYITINGGYVTATGLTTGAGIGGGLWSTGSNITINGGNVTAIGGDEEDNIAGIGSGFNGSMASNIFVADNIILKAGTSANPTTVILHATSTTDVALDLERKQYATAVEQTANITYDTSMYVAGNFTNWQAGMQKLPYTYEFPLDDEVEFKQVKRVIRFADNVAVDTTYTWYGSQTANDYMTESQSSRQLSSTGTYSVHINTGDDYGEYTFYYNAANDHFEVAWPGNPAPVAKIYAKNNWNGGEWTWKEMTFDGAIYVLDSVVYGGTGIYINNKTSDVDALFYDRTTMQYIGGTDSIQATDTVNFTFNKNDSVFVAELVGRVPDTLNYLHFVSLKDNGTVQINKGGGEFSFIMQGDIEYSTDNRATWNEYTFTYPGTGGTGVSININEGDTVWFRAGGDSHKNETFSKSKGFSFNFAFGANDSIAAGGNIMSLLDATLQQDTVPVNGFIELFKNCTALVSAPELPAHKMTPSCYESMFENCTNLVSAPDLTISVLANNCFASMFNNCAKLNVDTFSTACTGAEFQFPDTTSAPNYWNNQMFTGCQGAYANNIQAGGSYCISEYVEIKEFEYTLSQNVDETYSGMAKSVSVTVTDPATGATVKYSTDKGDTWTDGASVSRTNAGTDSVIFKLSAVGYKDTITDTVVLNVSKRYIMMTSSSDEKTYDGEPLTNSNVAVSGDLFIEGEGATYNVTGTQTAAGSSANTFTYTLNSFTLADNYDIDTTYGTLTVTAADISNATIADIPNQVHTGDSIKPGLNITLGSYDLVAGTDYTVSYINNVEIGTATANVTGVGNFTGTASKEFTIVPDTFDITVNVNDAAMGSATGTGRYVEYTTATLTATANEHYHFTGWDNGHTENPYTVYVEKDSTITAQFALDSFKLNVVAGEPDWGGVYGTGEYEYGAVRTISAQAANHFHFVKWSNGVTDANTTVTLTSDSTIVAIFAMDRNTVTLTVNNPALGTVEGAGEYDYYDNTITVIAVPANNHVRFDGWYSSNQFVDGLDTLYHIQIANDINLEARFYLDQHVVTATAGEGGSVTGGNTYNHGATATLVATPAAHYHFVNWSNGSVNDTLRFVVDTTYSFTANFAIDEHVVRTNVNNTAAGSVTGAGTYNYGDTATLTAIPAAHYEFVQWSNGLTDTTINVVLAGDTTLTATFARDEHIITVNNNNTGMGTVSGGSVYTHGDMATITATANEHYHFVNWSNGVTSTTFGILVEKDSTVAANFAIDRHNVNVLRNNNAYGTVTGAGEYDYGQTVNLTATANQYYHFTGWSNGIQTANMTMTLAGDTTVTANFAVDTFDIVTNLNVDSMGTVTGAGRYTYGQMVTLTATPAADHHFVNWSNGETRNSFSFMPDSNVTLTAIFAINEQQVTVSSVDDALGTVAGSGTYNWGTMVTVTATPADHYHFTGWSDGSMANPYRFKLTNDTMLVASFAIDTFTVTVSANYDSLGTVTGAGRYTYGTAVTLTATPVEHYHVAGWSNGMTGDSINVVVTSDSDLVAYFEIDTFFVTGNVIGVGQIENLGVYNDGDTVTLIASQTADNYTFAGWTGDTTGIEMFTDLSSDIIIFVVTRDVEFTATFVYVPTSVDDPEEVNYVAFTEGMNVVVNGVEDRMVAVYDMTGKLVKVVKSAQDVERISVHAAGIYMVRVDNKTTLRVVVK